MLKYKHKKVPLGYRDTDLELKILLNTYYKKGYREGYVNSIKETKAKGMKISNINVIHKLLDMRLTSSEIIKITGITRKELNEISENKIS